MARLTKGKLGMGEAEAIVLCKEIGGYALLTSDRHAASKAETYGVKTMNMADVVEEAYRAKVASPREVLRLLDTLIDQHILDTLRRRRLREEAKRWR